MCPIVSGAHVMNVNEVTGSNVNIVKYRNNSATESLILSKLGTVVLCEYMYVVMCVKFNMMHILLMMLHGPNIQIFITLQL